MTPDEEVRTFSHSERLYPANLVTRGKAVRPLPRAATELTSLVFQSNGRTYDLYDYLADDRIAGLLVLKDGQIVLERYELGLQPATRWASWSMAKSVSSTLIGAAVQQGLIGSLDEPVSRYVAALRDSAYDAVSIRDVLQMSSGVGWSETHTVPGG